MSLQPGDAETNSALVLAALYHVRRKFEQGWTHSTMARDKFGTSCFASSANAVAWCYMGAMLTTPELDGLVLTQANDYMDRAAFIIYSENHKLYPGVSPTIINDRIIADQKEALVWVDRAIQIAKEA